MCLKNLKYFFILKGSLVVGAGALSPGAMDADTNPQDRGKEHHKYKSPPFMQWATGTPVWERVSTLPRAALAQLGAREKMLVPPFHSRRIPSGVPSWHTSPMRNITNSMEQIIIDLPVKPVALTKKLEFSECSHNLYEERTRYWNRRAIGNMTPTLTFPGHRSTLWGSHIPLVGSPRPRQASSQCFSNYGHFLMGFERIFNSLRSRGPLQRKQQLRKWV